VAAKPGEGGARAQVQQPGEWSLALWTHPARPDGILYHSRHDDDEFCAAPFDRAADAIGHPRSERLLSSTLLRGLLTRYRVSLDPRG